MTKFSRWLILAGIAGPLLAGTAFAQSASTGAMSASNPMAKGAMTSMRHAAMSSGAMRSREPGRMSAGAMMSHGHGHMSSGGHMKKGSHAKMSRHSRKKSRHMSSGAMAHGH